MASRMARLLVSPVKSLFDTPVTVNVSGLKSNQNVTLSASVNYMNGLYQSTAHYVADKNGAVNLDQQPSVGGSFEGLHPMGPFWSLKPAPNQRPGMRLLPRDAREPINYEFKVHEGHVTDCAEPPLAHSQIERHLLHPHVTFTEIEVGRLRGALFVPKVTDGRPIPAIIDLFGTAGGLVQHRSALLAAHGFASLSLAYFAYKDLPKGLDPPLELDYFEEAIEWLTAQPNIRNDAVGVVGVSLGADIAMLAGIHLPKVKAAVSINAFHMVETLNPLSYKGVPLPICEGDLSVVEFEDGVLNYGPVRREMIPRTEEHMIYPVEKAPPDVKFLMLPCSDDQNTPAVSCAAILKEKFAKCGKENQLQVVECEGAGHLLEPPYIPHCPFSFHKVGNCLITWGGDMYKHAAAQENAWQILRDFLAQNLGEPAKMEPFDAVIRSSL